MFFVGWCDFSLSKQSLLCSRHVCKKKHEKEVVIPYKIQFGGHVFYFNPSSLKKFWGALRVFFDAITDGQVRKTLD